MPGEETRYFVEYFALWCCSVCLFMVVPLFFFNAYLFIFERERERESEHTSRGGAEIERETHNPKPASGPAPGLKLTHCEITT